MGLFGNKTDSETDAIGQLRKDHEQLKHLFEQFEEAEDRRTKQQIVNQALTALTVHAQLEEELFYPAARKAGADDEEIDDLMDEALQEHHVAKMLIAELEKMKPGDEFYDAKFTVLAESVKHHIKEEESEMFPKVEDEGDWEQIGERMHARRQALLEGSGRSNMSGNGRGKAGGARGKTVRSLSRERRATAKMGHPKSAAARRK